MSAGGIGEVLPWDSEFFGFRIGRLHADAFCDRGAGGVERWARDNALRCVYYLADGNDVEGVRAAEELGFRRVDVRWTRERSLADVQPSALELAEEEDLPFLLELARKSHRITRFYKDPHFDDARCDDLYARWLERGYHDPDQAICVVRQSGRAVGYSVSADRGDSVGELGLIAVAPEARATGLGGRLVQACLVWLAARGCKRVEVVTQGCNRAANRLYEQLGFRTQRMDYWFHWWPQEAGS